MPKPDPVNRPINSPAIHASVFGQVRSQLAQAGISQQQIDDAIGTDANGRSRYEIAQAIKVLLS